MCIIRQETQTSLNGVQFKFKFKQAFLHFTTMGLLSQSSIQAKCHSIVYYISKVCCGNFSRFKSCHYSSMSPHFDLKNNNKQVKNMTRDKKVFFQNVYRESENIPEYVINGCGNKSQDQRLNFKYLLEKGIQQVKTIFQTPGGSAQKGGRVLKQNYSCNQYW